MFTDVNPTEWSTDTMNAISQYIQTEVNCEIVDKLPNNVYTISCDTLKNLIDSNLH